MWKFLMRLFRKNIKICDQCQSAIDIDRDVAICLRGIQEGISYEAYVCEPCCEKLAQDFDLDEEVEYAEEN